MRLASLFFAAAVLFAQAPAKERALGERLAAEFEDINTPLQDAAVNAYLRRIGQALAKTSGLAYPLTFRAIDTSDPVGAALPGGYVYVSSGLITRAEDEAELAAVLAHEIAHIAARHGIRDAAAQPGAVRFYTIPMFFIGPSGGVCTRFDKERVLPQAFESSAVANEKEADALALHYLRKAGYDPDALWAMFSRLRARSAPARTERP